MALLDDLLTLAREGDEVADREPVELGGFIVECWNTVGTGDATLDVDIERTISADESRLQQVFENLFRNAAEHGGPDVTVVVGELSNGFYVEDDGPGIPPEGRRDIFEAGYSTSDAGTGFGLSIVREIIGAHGWDIRMTEGDSGGARFEITGVDFVTEEST